VASSLVDSVQPLLEAGAFAARAHQHQLRKDGQTPYVSHVFRVCLIVRHVFAIEDRSILIAALLHDTVEDTTRDFDDINEQFGSEIAQWVAALSKDKRLPESEREQSYCDQLARAPWQVKICKLADVFDNLMDAGGSKLELRTRVLRNARRYLDALKANLPKQASKPWQMVDELFEEIKARKG
jgi:guanosine-3',5'-bis(diphosphate) 3'-pyrophosphohydrolase